jgi:hypothetical protein
MKSILVLCVLAFLFGPRLHAATTPDPWYTEAQINTGLGTGWDLWGSPPGYVSGRTTDTGLSLGLGKEFNGHARAGLLLEQNGWDNNGVSFNKVIVTGGLYAPFWKVMRVGLDLGLGGFVRSAAGTDSLGGLVLGDLRLQADLVRGFYLLSVMDWQDYMISFDKTPDWVMLTAVLKLGWGSGFKAGDNSLSA